TQEYLSFQPLSKLGAEEGQNDRVIAELEPRPLEILHRDAIFIVCLGQWVAELTKPTVLQPECPEAVLDIVAGLREVVGVGLVKWFDTVGGQRTCSDCRRSSWRYRSWLWGRGWRRS